MAQDTRKDPRAKVLTMTVRYKSATVDEFIEHHSHDVSRGGIYIKTPSPFLPGTLLKFEIRIANDQAMLQGVGRVVWKREPASAGPDKPAGMGVKFIKVDEASRNLIDRLVATKGAATSAYDAEAPADLAAAAAASPPPPPRSAPPVNRAGVGAAPARQATLSGGPVRKATMIGLGIDGASSSSPARARPPEPMFPKTSSEADMPPPEERTVMKQAAELLEEALKGAGGSIDEVGSAPAAPEPRARVADVDDEDDDELTIRAAVEPAPVAPSARVDSAPPIPLQRRPLSDPTAARQGSFAGPSSRPSARGVPSSPYVEPVKKKASGRAALSLLLVAGAAAAAYVAWQKAPSESAPAAQPAAPVVTTPPPPPPPVLTVAPAPTEPPAPAPSAAPPSPPAVTNTLPPPLASAAAPVIPPITPPRTVKPAEVAHPAEKPAPAEKPIAAPKPKPVPKPAVEEGTAPPVEKKPRPAPKPDDDNPY
jgi:uncharacterized protein (TIGR02266 family)